LKLLCRFSDPDSGRIEFDGTDSRDLVVCDPRNAMTVLFQIPVQYHATARKSIGESVGESKRRGRLARCARGAGAREIVSRLPRAYDALLGRHFGNGVQLSAGEWRRIALARAFLRNAPVIVLDQPTSFMDSWAETDWLKRFCTLASDRTAMLITHRFTTAMEAHNICVIKKARSWSTEDMTSLATFR
jgi:ATP-binding cassette subfamily B protein